MKSGTGDDPFADPFEDADEQPEAEAQGDTDETAADTDAHSVGASSGESTETASTGNIDDTTAAAGTPEATAEQPAGTDADTDTDTSSDLDSVSDSGSAAATTPTESSQPDDSHIPWVLRRSSVKDDRPNITQFFLRDETDRAERGLRSDVEQILDKDVYTLDLREAAYLVAMEHPEEVAETLRGWGYDYLD